MLGGTPAQDPLSQVVPGNDDMGGDRDAIVAQIAQLIEHPDPTQKPLWDGSGLPETAAEMQELDMEDLKRKVTLMLSQALGPARGERCNLPCRRTPPPKAWTQAAVALASD